MNPDFTKDGWEIGFRDRDGKMLRTTTTDGDGFFVDEGNSANSFFNVSLTIFDRWGYKWYVREPSAGFFDVSFDTGILSIDTPLG
jgi:hypothetical protein